MNISLEGVALEPNKKRSNFRTVLVMTLIFIFVLGVLAYVGGVITSVSDLSRGSEAKVIVISALVGVALVAIVALFRLSKEDR